MKIVGLMLVRNEEWILGMTLRAALKWCDSVVVLDHGSKDGTPGIVAACASEHAGRVIHLGFPAGAGWNEMDLRQAMLDEGRKIGGTHFAIIDADEMLTANLIPVIKYEFNRLQAGTGLAFRMVSPYCSLGFRRTDGYYGKETNLFLGFMDAPFLEWRAASDGYQFHARPPYGIKRPWPILRPEMVTGGVFHFQFVTRRRLEVKAAWYKMVETLQWPGRMSPEALNKKYDWTLDETGITSSPVDENWWLAYADIRHHFDPHAEPWQTAECRRMIAEHGREKFVGLTLHGVV